MLFLFEGRRTALDYSVICIVLLNEKPETVRILTLTRFQQVRYSTKSLGIRPVTSVVLS